MKKIFTIISITSILLVLFPLFIEAFIDLESDYWAIVREHKDSWISYYGAIIGGGLTLFGVWWTITENKKDLKEQQNRLDEQRKEDLAIQYKPYLILTQNKKIDLNAYDIFIMTNNNTHPLNETVILKNIGRGEAIINDIQIKVNKEPIAELLKIKTAVETSYVNSNITTALTISISADFYSLEKERPDIDCDIIIKYTDLFEKYYYTETINISFKKVYFSLSTIPEIDNSSIETRYEISFKQI